MMTVTYQRNKLLINGNSFEISYEIRDAFMLGEKIIVLIDPNSYLNDPNYSKERRRGINPLKNLIALSSNGSLIWEAEFPEKVDYYYSISSRTPLIAYTFSSYKCEIDITNGKIKSKVFLK